jgi:E3 ubiquitin-protein ligase UHRF1
MSLASGYPEDEDYGNWFMYTGSGGKDLKTKNRRTGKQTFDQELTKGNLALAATCDAPVPTPPSHSRTRHCTNASQISEDGGVAKNWQNSKGIRVVRSDKLRKHHPQFAPELGNRYDGIYKIVRYFPDTSKSGFRVFRYEFRRDDPVPAPWTKQGKARIKELGIQMIYPETYDQTATEARGLSGIDEEIYKDPSPSPSILGKRKRLHNPFATLDTFPDLAVVITTRSNQEQRHHSNSIIPIMRLPTFTIPSGLQELIDIDIASTPSHQRLWSSIMDQKPINLRGFITALERELNCPVCQDFVQKPITNLCGHIACLPCMKRSVDGFGPKCPTCRACLIDTEDGNSDNTQQHPKVVEKMKRVWKSQAQVNEKLVEVIRFYNQDYGKEKGQS